MRQLLIVGIAMLVLLSAAGLYGLKHKVQTKREAVLALEEKILADAEALRVLQAEWAYLSSPAVIQDRTVRYLRLRPLAPDQIIGDLGGLPYRLDPFVVSALPNDDIRPVPSPRAKPSAPVRDALALSSNTVEEIRKGDRLAVLPVSKAVSADKGTKGEFAARMERALERVGGR